MIVLNYHELSGGQASNPWCLNWDLFDAHLAAYSDRLIAPETFLARCQDPAYATSPEVLLTFDDGFESDYSRVFAHHTSQSRIPFVSFIPVEHVGEPGRMTWDMIDELSRHGITIGSHGLAHVDLTSVPRAEAERELRVSKSVLEDRLGRSVDLFAFPYGKFSMPVCDLALNAGYSHLFTIQLGHHNGFEPFLYSRLCMQNTMDVDTMRRHLENPCQNRGLAWRASSSLGIYPALMRWRFR